jgi:hypothetical protein
MEPKIILMTLLMAAIQLLASLGSRSSRDSFDSTE